MNSRSQQKEVWKHEIQNRNEMEWNGIGNQQTSAVMMQEEGHRAEKNDFIESSKARQGSCTNIEDISLKRNVDTVV